MFEAGHRNETRAKSVKVADGIVDVVKAQRRQVDCRATGESDGVKLRIGEAAKSLTSNNAVLVDQRHIPLRLWALVRQVDYRSALPSSARVARTISSLLFTGQNTEAIGCCVCSIRLKLHCFGATRAPLNRVGST